MITDSSIVSTDYELFTYKSVSNFTFTEIDIRKTIRDLDLNNTHGPDMMSIRIIKIVGDSIYKESGLTVRACLDLEFFAQNCKKEPKLSLFMNTIVKKQ